MLLQTLSACFQVALTTDSTDATYPTRGVTLAEPTGTGVINMGWQGQEAPNGMRIIPYGTTTAAQSFLMRVLGWTENRVNGIYTWVPHVIGEFTCTLSTMAGVAGGVPDANHLICDTITLVTGTATPNVSTEVVSPTGNIAAHIMLNLKGVRKAEFIFNMNSSAVSANALVAVL